MGKKVQFPFLLAIPMTVTKLLSTCITTQYIIHLPSIQLQEPQGVVKKAVQPLVKVKFVFSFIIS